MIGETAGQIWSNPERGCNQACVWNHRGLVSHNSLAGLPSANFLFFFLNNRSPRQILTVSFQPCGLFMKRTQYLYIQCACALKERRHKHPSCRWSPSHEVHDRRTVTDHTAKRRIDTMQTCYLLYINIALVCLSETNLAAGRWGRNREQTLLLSWTKQTHLHRNTVNTYRLCILPLNSKKHIFEICTDGHHVWIQHC